MIQPEYRSHRIGSASDEDTLKSVTSVRDLIRKEA